MIVDLNRDEIEVLLYALEQSTENLRSKFMAAFDTVDSKYKILRHSKIAQNELLIKKLSDLLEKSNA